jgi:hypothetical protein
MSAIPGTSIGAIPEDLLNQAGQDVSGTSWPRKLDGGVSVP